MSRAEMIDRADAADKASARILDSLRKGNLPAWRESHLRDFADRLHAQALYYRAAAHTA